MDLISNRTSNISHLAMNGLLERQRAIGANIANVETPGYQRKEVVFENQLSEIIEKEDLKDYIKEQLQRHTMIFFKFKKGKCTEDS